MYKRQDDNGIEYTSIGANGAKFESYERCNYFYSQLSLYMPDLFIISIGTNDTSVPVFDAEKYKENYKRMIDNILRINPDCAILLTVPNDSYYKKTVNKFNKEAESVIHSLANEYKMAVWDVYDMMGGEKSSYTWYKKGLMVKDKIHFNHKGYYLKADLLLEALAHSFEEVTGLKEDTFLNQLIHE